MAQLDEVTPNPPDFFLKAVCFELGLGLVAFAIGILARHNPASTLLHDQMSPSSLGQLIGWGILAALPLNAGLLVLDRFPVGPFRALQDLTSRLVIPLFSGMSTWKLLALSLAAGVGEELLFRGLVQARLAASIPQGLALTVAAVLFGLCHWLSTTYAVVAIAMGFYLGALFLVSESILVPVVTHAAYDFLALVYFLKWRRKEAQT